MGDWIEHSDEETMPIPRFKHGPQPEYATWQEAVSDSTCSCWDPGSDPKEQAQRLRRALETLGVTEK
jgi:hypothetical protein